MGFLFDAMCVMVISDKFNLLNFVFSNINEIMAEETFSELGKIEAVRQLFAGTGFEQNDNCILKIGKDAGSVINASVVMTEGIDFDFTYFPLKHLGYKSVIEATGEIYAAMAHPETLAVRLGISSRFDFGKIKELWEGMVSAARKHGYRSLSLDLLPSVNGLYICISATGTRANLTEKRRMQAKSMDLICISGNLGAAFMGMQILEKEKQKFLKRKTDRSQPDLSDHKIIIGEYLKPEINPSFVSQLEDAEIIPSYGYFVNRGLSDAVKRLVRDSGLGAKIYVERLPFASGTFDLGKQFDIDPISAAFNGGDDCRLLFTIPIGKHDRFRHDFQTFDIIGHLARPEVGAVLVTPEGVELPVTAQGWKK